MSPLSKPQRDNVHDTTVRPALSIQSRIEDAIENDALNLVMESQTRQNAARYLAIQALICGGKGQQFVEEIALEGVQPTPKQLNQRMDRIIDSNNWRAV